MGKKLSLCLLLLAIALLALPPVFCHSQQEAVRKIDFSAFSAASLVLSFVLLSLSPSKRTASLSAKQRFASFILSIKAATFCLASLMLIFAFFQAVQAVLPQGVAAGQQSVQMPSGALGWASLVLALASGALFEEALYRQFLPETLIALLPQKRLLAIAGELLCVALFALAHKGGPLALLNAASCGAALRFFRRKSPTVIPVFAAHFVYNLTLTLFALLL